MVFDLLNIKPKHSRSDEEEKLLEPPRDLMIEEDSQDVLAHWRGPEHEMLIMSRKTLLISGLLLAVIIGYFLITNSPIAAITFILIGVVGYLYLQKEPRILDFAITHDGIAAGQELYDFDNIKSFWIFYNPPRIKILSLHLKHNILPYIHIPLHDEDPVKIREILLDFIPEIKQEPTIVDTIEQLLQK